MAQWYSGRVPDLRSLVLGFESQPPTLECNPGQVVKTRVPLSPSSIIWYQPTGSAKLLSPSSIIWYQPMGGDAMRLGR